jgi:alpha-beta hydrolase superfamily lysophospholipase
MKFYFYTYYGRTNDRDSSKLLSATAKPNSRQRTDQDGPTTPDANAHRPNILYIINPLITAMEPVAGETTADDGTRLRVWELPPPGADEAVLFLHGAITCSRALFAPPVPDDTSYSWLHATTEGGRAAFAVDVRGYGDSERPPELDEPPEANEPPVRARDAAIDVRAAYEHVADRYETVHLVGVSWGTMTGGTFLAEGNPDVASATLCAPVFRPPYEFEPAMADFGVDPDLDAYIVQTREEVLDRQADDESTLLFEAVWKTMVESGQGVEGRDAYLAQAGALADVRAGCAGESVYDPSDIAVPTLVIRGSADAVSQREDALGLYDELGVPDDRAEYAEIGGGDHYVMHGHRRGALFDAVAAFQDRA